MSDFETCDSLQPCEVCEGRRYWFSGLQWNCCKCKPPPLDCMITFDVGKLAWCTPSPLNRRSILNNTEPGRKMTITNSDAMAKDARFCVLRNRTTADSPAKRLSFSCGKHARSGGGDARRKHF